MRAGGLRKDFENQLMNTILSILHLEGYGIYVWPAYAMAVLTLAWMALSTLRHLRRSERTLETLQRRRTPAAGAGSEEGGPAS